MTPSVRQSVVSLLLQKSVDGDLNKGDITQVASLYNVHRNTVARIWKRHKATTTRENVLGDIQHHRKGRCGVGGFDLEELRLRIKAIPLRRRMTVRALSHELDVSTSVVQRLMKTKEMRRHSSNVKPVLTDENKMERVDFCLAHIGQDASGRHQFDDMYDVVHVDEKWFNEDTDKRTFYLLKDEEEPQRRRKSKRFIGKTMFLAAVARPR